MHIITIRRGNYTRLCETDVNIAIQVQYSHWDRSRELNDQKLIKTEIALGEYTDRDKFNNTVDAIKVTNYYIFVRLN